MNWIEKMIVEQCPNGVEMVKLGKECEIKTGKGITQKEAQLGGDYPIISGGITPMGMFHIKNRNANTITISRVGANAGYVDFIRKDFYLNDKCFSVIPYKENIFCIKFLFFYLKSIEDKIKDLQSEGGVPTINTTKIGTLEIPLPPLSIQEEIVSVLDKFSELIEKTDEEIALRQKQYEYYREKLLTFEKGEVEWKKLGEVCDITTGKKPNEILEKGIYDYINAGTSRSGYTNDFNSEGNVVTTPSRGQGGIGYVAFQHSNFWCGPLCYKISAKIKKIYIKFLYFFLSEHNDLILNFKCEGGTPALNRKDLATVPTPIPSLSRQQEIVETLDKFEALISKLKEERELRQKQYEYYREKLLTF